MRTENINVRREMLSLTEIAAFIPALAPVVPSRPELSAFHSHWLLPGGTQCARRAFLLEFSSAHGTPDDPPRSSWLPERQCLRRIARAGRAPGRDRRSYAR